MFGFIRFPAGFRGVEHGVRVLSKCLGFGRVFQGEIGFRV